MKRIEEVLTQGTDGLLSVMQKFKNGTEAVSGSPSSWEELLLWLNTEVQDNEIELTEEQRNAAQWLLDGGYTSISYSGLFGGGVVAHLCINGYYCSGNNNAFYTPHFVAYAFIDEEWLQDREDQWIDLEKLLQGKVVVLDEQK